MSNNGKQEFKALQALDPLRPGLLQPWKDYVTRGLIKIALEFSPTGTLAYCVLLQKELIEQIPDGTNAEMVPLGLARELINNSRFANKPNGDNKKKGKGKGERVEPPKPTRHLRMDEFQGNDDMLKSRISSVAEAIAGNVAYGRISSNGLLKEGVSDFVSWWKVAKPAERAACFLTSKDMKSLDNDSDEGQRIGLFFRDLQCPFRGPLVQQSSQSEAEKETGESSTSQQENQPQKGKGIERANAIKK